MIYKSVFKPLFDRLVSFFVLLGFMPLLIILMVFIFLDLKRNPFFFQKRPGKSGEIFRVIKFKTMTDKRHSDGNLLPDSERLTKLGVFIRKSSLDEIPQLINVLKGDMSIVGPRPLLPEYLPLYNESQKQRHNVKPGITGWAQVNGRNAISWKKKFEYDIWYVKNISFLFDLRIIFMTVKKVLKSDGINNLGEATTTKFTGN